MLARPRTVPSDAPTSRTANVWPVIGTGVNGRETEIWAAPATSPAPPTTRAASVRTSKRGTSVADVARALMRSYRQSQELEQGICVGFDVDGLEAVGHRSRRLQA